MTPQTMKEMKEKTTAPRVHPTAVVHPEAQLAPSVVVGPYAIIGPHVQIGEETRLGPFVVIDGHTTIGRRCQFFTGAVIGSVSQDRKFKGERTYLVIGEDNVFREYVTVNLGTEAETRTVIGSGNLFMAYSHVAHNCVIGSRCVIANNGTFAGHVTLEDHVTLGGLSAVHQFVRVGTLAIIGGCSKVVKDVPPYALADGHPCRVYGVNTVGLNRAGLSEEAKREIKAAYRILLKDEFSPKEAADQIEQDLPSLPELKRLVEFIRTSERGLAIERA